MVARMSSTPHDALFTAVLGQPEHAAGPLRSVIPPAIADVLDWPTLTAVPGSFVDAQLVSRRTDLLFTINWRGGGDALIYLLYEHQSTADPRMPFRLLRYMTRIWERWQAEHNDADWLPVIIPVVLYHGEERWSAPVTFHGMFRVPEAIRSALAPYLVQFTYLLDSLSKVQDDQLRDRVMTASAQLVIVSLKHARTRPDFLEILSAWAATFRELVRTPNGQQTLDLVARYILDVSDHVSPQQFEALAGRMAGPRAEEIVMTAGERLIEEGKRRGLQEGEKVGEKRGLQEGEKRGLQEGEKRGFQKVLLRQLRCRFGSQVDAEIERRVSTASTEQIAVWTDRVLSATTLAEVLAD
jgi:predicted transposase/invertase (TIGR01784 family)